jgi:8-oxo-dGTP diphosphatase
MGVLLFIVSFILSAILLPIGFVYGFIKTFYNTRLNRALRDINLKFWAMGVSADQFGNVVCKELFNATLITSNSIYLFGNEDETISSVIGRNLKAGTLSKTGKILNSILNFFQKDHAINSIGS